MSANSGPRRRIGWSATALMATTVAMVAPSAAAAEINMSLEAAPPGGYVTGTEYRITMPEHGGADFDNRIVFTDNGQCFAAFWRIGNKDSTGSSRVFSSVTIDVIWVPKTVGTHSIVATAAGTSVTYTVNAVAAPIGTPPPPAEDPNTNGCNDTGNPYADQTSTGSF
ncbi:hypothetical protein ACWIGI_06250 [Nocardia sp. NPDC055321]